MVRTMKWIVIAVLASGCMSIAHDAKPRPSTQALAIAGGVVLASAALAGAHYAHDAPIGEQAGIAIATSAIPMAAIYLGEEDDEEVSTPGGIYSSMLSGLGASFGAALTFSVPMAATSYTGGDVESSSGKVRGVAAGVFLGTVAAVGTARGMPKWARVVVGAAIVGASATLGAQLGGGEPR